jgi:hypothetical protein
MNLIRCTSTPDANMLLSVRFACALGSQRKSLRALWLIVGSKLTDNEQILLLNKGIQIK